MDHQPIWNHQQITDLEPTVEPQHDMNLQTTVARATRPDSLNMKCLTRSMPNTHGCLANTHSQQQQHHHHHGNDDRIDASNILPKTQRGAARACRSKITENYSLPPREPANSKYNLRTKKPRTKANAPSSPRLNEGRVKDSRITKPSARAEPPITKWMQAVIENEDGTLTSRLRILRRWLHLRRAQQKITRPVFQELNAFWNGDESKDRFLQSLSREALAVFPLCKADLGNTFPWAQRLEEIFDGGVRNEEDMGRGGDLEPKEVDMVDEEMESDGVDVDDGGGVSIAQAYDVEVGDVCDSLMRRLCYRDKGSSIFS